ncbi:MAG TPA: toxin-antitoxin system YwqK family antitoxin [Puia sp.]|nr:toxin-antitoxin system YwqK family antitoxin [Puia sp.]
MNQKTFVVVLVAGLCACSPRPSRDVVSRYPNGRPEEVIDRIDAGHYYQRELYPNGLLKTEKQFVDGKQDGMETHFNDEDGAKTAEMSFKDGKRNGITHEFFHNGRIAFEGACADGKFEGVSTWYYRNGRVQETGRRHLGQDTGWWNYYDTSGALLKAARYSDDGRPVGLFDGHGAPIGREVWDSLHVTDEGR